MLPRPARTIGTSDGTWRLHLPTRVFGGVLRSVDGASVARTMRNRTGARRLATTPAPDSGTETGRIEIQMLADADEREGVSGLPGRDPRPRFGGDRAGTGRVDADSCLQRHHGILEEREGEPGLGCHRIDRW